MPQVLASLTIVILTTIEASFTIVICSYYRPLVSMLVTNDVAKCLSSSVFHPMPVFASKVRSFNLLGQAAA